MLALRWADVDFEHGIFTIEKSRSVAKNRAGGEESNKYVLVEGSAQNAKARKLALTAEALKVLKIIWHMQNDHGADSLIVRTRTGKGKAATKNYYIAVRKKRVVEGNVQQIVELPEAFQTEEKTSKLQDTSSA